MSETGGQSGRSVVVKLYVAITLLAGVMGLILGTVSPQGLDPELFGVIQLPPTPLGVAIFGMVTVGVGFAVLLGLVVVVSKKYADGPESA